jgi:hypothetical protein
MNGDFKLIVNQGPQPGRTFVLDRDLFILGRDPGCNIVIDAPQVSRQHARIRKYGGQVVIEDLRSANGTFVNGMRLTGPRTLVNGDVISLGGVVTFTCTYPPVPAPYQSPPRPQYPPSPRQPPTPVAAPPKRTRRRFPCLIVALVLVLLGGSVTVVAGWFYGDQVIAWLKGIAQDTRPPLDGGTPSGSPVDGGAASAVTVTADDGASVTFPPFSGTGTVEATLTQVVLPSGQSEDDAMVVSSEYLLAVSDPGAICGDVIVALPLATDLLPADWDPAGLVPEFLNPADGLWEPVGQVLGYDEEQGQVLFDVPFVPADTAGHVPGGRAPGVMVPAYQASEVRYRIRLHFFSNWVTLVPSPSDFEIEYYPISGLSYSLQSDGQWQSSSALVTDPQVPDFAEDLSHALNQGYQGLLGIQQTTGPLFQPLGGVQKVVVTNIGAVEGQTSLFWGTVKISNSRITSWPQMQQVATHELTHLLCDQYYNSHSAAANRWFFEATAEYFAARARGLSAAARGQHYASPAVVSDVYLSIPLVASNVSSYYPAGHFLDWCSHRYGESVVPTAIVYGSYHPLDRNDVAHFSEALVLHGEPGGIGAAYGAYARDLISRPEDYGGANAVFKSNVTAYAAAQGHLSASQFDEYVTYIKLSRSLPPLASTGTFLQGRNSDRALLVIDSSASSGGALQAITYDFGGGSNETYEQTPPVDAGLAFPYPSPGTVTVADFGRLETKKQIEQLIANTSTSQAAQVDVIYYILRPPPVTTVEKGAVTWSCAKVGNMPRELIQGYHVYKDGTRLTGEPVGLPAEGWDQRFESDQIEAGDALLVQVVDRAGNAWPPVTAPQATPTPTPTPTPTATPTPEGTEIPDATVTPDAVITPGAAQLTLELQPGDAVQVVIEQDGMQESCTGGNCGEEGGFASMAPGLLLAYWYTVDSVQGDTVILNQPESYDSAEITLVFHRDQNTIDLQYDASDSYSDENMATTGEDHKTFSGLPLASVADDAWYFALEAPAAAGHLTGDSVTTCTSYDPDAPGCWCNGGLRTSCSTRSTIWADEGTSLYITLSRRP